MTFRVSLKLKLFSKIRLFFVVDLEATCLETKHKRTKEKNSFEIKQKKQGHQEQKNGGVYQKNREGGYQKNRERAKKSLPHILSFFYVFCFFFSVSSRLNRLGITCFEVSRMEQRLPLLQYFCKNHSLN